MTDTSAHGKHLFLHFDEDILHVHLGLYGWFDLYKNKGQQPKGAVRLRMENDLYMSDLRAPTACNIFVDRAEFDKVINRLGPDPIHENADPEKAWYKIHKSSKTIGALLMDQAVIAGIGNVYRAELLFMSNLSPFTSGMQVTREKFDEVWKNSVRLLRDGATDGRIRTVAPEHIAAEEYKLHGDKHYSYVYKRTGSPCLICRQPVLSGDLAGRTVYWCDRCQCQA